MQRPAGRKARQVSLVAERQQRPFEEGGRDFVADPGGHGAQQKASPAVSVLGQRGQVAQTAQVHVARGDGEAVAVVEVAGEVGQGVAVVGGVGLVVEEGGRWVMIALAGLAEQRGLSRPLGRGVRRRNLPGRLRVVSGVRVPPA